jgi:hypothetical protein
VGELDSLKCPDESPSARGTPSIDRFAIIGAVEHHPMVGIKPIDKAFHQFGYLSALRKPLRNPQSNCIQLLQNSSGMASTIRARAPCAKIAGGLLPPAMICATQAARLRSRRQAACAYFGSMSCRPGTRSSRAIARKCCRNFLASPSTLSSLIRRTACGTGIATEGPLRTMIASKHSRCI